MAGRPKGSRNRVSVYGRKREKAIIELFFSIPWYPTRRELYRDMEPYKRAEACWKAGDRAGEVAAWNELEGAIREGLAKEIEKGIRG